MPTGSRLRREIEEELKLEGSYEDRVAGLINDDSTDVGRVHLGIVHVVTLVQCAGACRKKAISELQFLSVSTNSGNEEKCSNRGPRSLVDAWETI